MVQLLVKYNHTIPLSMTVFANTYDLCNFNLLVLECWNCCYKMAWHVNIIYGSESFTNRTHCHGLLLTRALPAARLFALQAAMAEGEWVVGSQKKYLIKKISCLLKI